MEEIEQQCARLLRDLRRRRGLTLAQFEELTKGEVKAVVLGSYERGTRAISLARLSQLAEIYEVPVEYFFTPSKSMESASSQSYIFDLRKIRSANNLEPGLETTKQFLARIAALRSDWNGEVLSIRRSDSELIALISRVEEGELSQLLRSNGFLLLSKS